MNEQPTAEAHGPSRLHRRYRVWPIITEEDAVPIDLLDIRSAVAAYVSTQVVSGTTQPTADVGGAINPGKEFSFSVLAKNMPAPNGIRVVNITYHVTIEPSSVAQLKVPASPPARASSFPSEPLLAPGSLVSGMFLFPTDNSLEPGDGDTIPGLKGKGISIGFANIRCHVHADLDLDSIFPKDNRCQNGINQVAVV
jgi:hypothetical protein